MRSNSCFQIALATRTYFTALLLAAALFVTQTGFCGEQAETIPDRGISVTLSVYSGRPNPHWWVVPSDPDYKRLIELIASLKTSDKDTVKYDEWNRLGYAGFWIVLKGVQGLPHRIHVWRDRAYVLKSKKEEAQYAVGAAKIYDLLVGQAEKRDLGDFFINYHKYQKEGKM